MTFEVILAAMLFIQPPGKSDYSVVVVPEDTPAPCSNKHDKRCAPPTWSKAHNGFVIVENYKQGFERYVTIAEALHKQVNAKKWFYKGTKGWKTPKKTLWRYSLASIYNESGFRRDVHDGVGSWALGDCKWTGPFGKRRRIPGTCRSYCLGQVMLGKKKSQEGYYGKDMIGISAESTRKCLTVSLRIMNRAYQYCTHHGPRHTESCVFGSYGGLRGDPRKDKRIISRVKTFYRIHQAPKTLTEEQKELLNETKRARGRSTPRGGKGTVQANRQRTARGY